MGKSVTDSRDEENTPGVGKDQSEKTAEWVAGGFSPEPKIGVPDPKVKAGLDEEAEDAGKTPPDPTD